VRLLADENIPLESVRALRTAGHDVFAATESAAGATDEVLLERAGAEERLIVTFDRDFGELATRHARAAPAGILLIRIVPRNTDEVTQLLLGLFARSEVRWSAQLSVVDRTHLRQRPLGG
jgi:predicted nuclease of predicted toxin-antitoxin system